MNEQLNVIKIGPIATAEENDDGTYRVLDSEGSQKILSREEFEKDWITYDCIPASVIPWLNSAIMQHMPLLTALGGTVPEDKYDYSKLTDDVLLWLDDPAHETTFVKSMFFGPRIKIEKNNEDTNEQLSLFDK